VSPELDRAVIAESMADVTKLCDDGDREACAQKRWLPGGIDDADDQTRRTLARTRVQGAAELRRCQRSFPATGVVHVTIVVDPHGHVVGSKTEADPSIPVGLLECVGKIERANSVPPYDDERGLLRITYEDHFVSAKSINDALFGEVRLYLFMPEDRDDAHENIGGLCAQHVDEACDMLRWLATEPRQVSLKDFGRVDGQTAVARAVSKCAEQSRVRGDIAFEIYADPHGHIIATRPETPVTNAYDTCTAKWLRQLYVEPHDAAMGILRTRFDVKAP
jgi:hypothetical protein